MRGLERTEFARALVEALTFCVGLLLLVDQQACGYFYAVIALISQTKITHHSA